ncbi:MAG: host attachment family protein [Pseudomonadota bacterium]
MASEKIKLVHDGWVVVADGEKALFLRNEGDEEHPNLDVFREEEQDNPPNREQAANRRGRVGNANGPHKSAVEDTDWHQLAKDRFAAELAEILYKKAHANTFQHLVLVADPSVLGEMRSELHQAVTDKLVAEVDKNLTNHPVHEIEELLLHKAA